MSWQYTLIVIYVATMPIAWGLLSATDEAHVEVEGGNRASLKLLLFASMCWAPIIVAYALSRPSYHIMLWLCHRDPDHIAKRLTRQEYLDGKREGPFNP